MEEPKPTQYETLFGGTPISVRVANHQERRVEHEQLQIRQLPVSAYQQAFGSVENEEAMVALFVDRPLEWVKRLVPEDYTRIAVEGGRLNADFFGYCDRRMEQQMAATRRIAPDLVERIAAQALASSASRS